MVPEQSEHNERQRTRAQQTSTTSNDERLSCTFLSLSLLFVHHTHPPQSDRSRHAAWTARACLSATWRLRRATMTWRTTLRAHRASSRREWRCAPTVARAALRLSSLRAPPRCAPRSTGSASRSCAAARSSAARTAARLERREAEAASEQRRPEVRFLPRLGTIAVKSCLQFVHSRDNLCLRSQLTTLAHARSGSRVWRRCAPAVCRQRAVCGQLAGACGALCAGRRDCGARARARWLHG